jgi:hypothetical protein
MAEDFNAPMPELEALFYDTPVTSARPPRKNAKKKKR